MNLRTIHALLPSLLLLPLAAHADTLYKCTDGNGQVLYTNQKGAGNKCTVLSRELPVAHFAAPKAKANSPGDFPRVSGDQQKARDNDRRAILDQELANEQKLLEEARKAQTEQEGIVSPEERMASGSMQGGKREARLQNFRDMVALHERNIEALRKEIGNLK